MPFIRMRLSSEISPLSDALWMYWFTSETGTPCEIISFTRS